MDPVQVIPEVIEPSKVEPGVEGALNYPLLIFCHFWGQPFGIWIFFSLWFISNYSIVGYLIWHSFQCPTYITLTVKPSCFSQTGRANEQARAMATPCRPLLVQTLRSSEGLANFLGVHFFYPEERRKESCHCHRQTFQMKGTGMPSCRALLVSASMGFCCRYDADSCSSTDEEEQPWGRGWGWWDYLGSLGDLLAREILGDFLVAQSSLSSTSLESEQLQLSSMAEIKLFP